MNTDFIDYAGENTQSQHANQRLLIRKEISHMLDEMSGNHTSSMKDTAAFAMIMMASVTRQSWGTHTIWVEAKPQEWIQHQTHTYAQTVSVSKFTSRKLSMAGIGCSMMTKRKIYRPMQDSKNGPSEKHFRQTRHGRRWGEKQSINDYSVKIDRKKCREGLTVLVAWLSEGFSFGENNGNSQILERWDVEETGVLVVSDVFGVVSACCVLALGEIGAGHITGTWRQREVIQVNLRTCITWCDAAVQVFSVHWCHSLRLGGPDLIPALLSHPDESQDLEAQAGEDLSQNRAEQRAGDEAGRRSAPHQLLPRWVQAHWRREESMPALNIWPLYLIPTHWLRIFFLVLLVKAMMRMMAMSIKRNWKSPRLLRICY